MKYIKRLPEALGIFVGYFFVAIGIIIVGIMFSLAHALEGDLK